MTVELLGRLRATLGNNFVHYAGMAVENSSVGLGGACVVAAFVSSLPEDIPKTKALLG